MPKKSVAVLFGGRSTEHEVSIISAHQVMEATEVAGFDVLPIYISKEGAWYAGRALQNLDLYRDSARDFASVPGVERVFLSPDRSVRRLVEHPAASKRLFHKSARLWADIFFPMVHGSFGEDGTLQGVLEMADVPYVGCDPRASTIAIDKLKTKSVCRDAGIPVLDCESASRELWRDRRQMLLRQVEEKFGFPLMVKPVSLGSSIGVKRCRTAEEVEAAIEAALVLDRTVLVEPALKQFKEINCSVLGPPERASVCEQPCTSEEVLSFDSKYRRGGKGKTAGSKSGMASMDRIIPAPVSTDMTVQVQALAIQSFRTIGAAGVARIDFLLDTAEDRLYLNELNTIPGSLSYYLWEASGLSFVALIRAAIDIAEQQYKDRASTQFAFTANLLGARA